MGLITVTNSTSDGVVRGLSNLSRLVPLTAGRFVKIRYLRVDYTLLTKTHGVTGSGYRIDYHLLAMGEHRACYHRSDNTGGRVQWGPLGTKLNSELSNSLLV